MRSGADTTPMADAQPQLFDTGPDPATITKADHDRVINALVDACYPGIDHARITRSQWATAGKAKADIVTMCGGDLAAAAEQIPIRAEWFVARFPTSTLTPTALSKWWHPLAQGTRFDTVSNWDSDAPDTFHVPHNRADQSVGDWDDE